MVKAPLFCGTFEAIYVTFWQFPEIQGHLDGLFEGTDKRTIMAKRDNNGQNLRNAHPNGSESHGNASGTDNYVTFWRQLCHFWTLFSDYTVPSGHFWKCHFLNFPEIQEMCQKRKWTRFGAFSWKCPKVTKGMRLKPFWTFDFLSQLSISWELGCLGVLSVRLSPEKAEV